MSMGGTHKKQLIEILVINNEQEPHLLFLYSAFTFAMIS
jgi:hypothetical protein